LFLFVATAVAQQPPGPGKEHEYFKAMVGEWDAETDFGGMQGKASSSMEMGVGGMWLVSHFKGEFGGQPFKGMGLDSYDSIKKKYVSVWVDSMTGSPMVFEGDKSDNGTLTMTGEGPTHEGKPGKFKSTTEIKDKDTMVFKMYMVEGDKDNLLMTITYKRKK
jgi:hypothetical protein